MSDDLPPRLPGVRAADADREAAVARLEAAMAEGRLDIEEVGQRVTAAYAAVTLDELDGLLADLPGSARTEIVGTRTPDEVTSIFGDVKLAGVSPPHRVSTVFGDVRIDLRAVRTDAPVIELYLRSVFGSVDVIVAEGVDAELHGRTVFGDRRIDLAPVPRAPGSPRVVVHGRTTFGDLRLRSLAPGEPASRWRAVLDRLAQARPPLPPGA